MKRHLFAGVLVAFVLVAAGWTAGVAQTRVSDFYITVEARTSEIRAVCNRGCDWTEESGTPESVITYRCSSQPCRLIFNGRGRVLVGQAK